jgi:NAD(P)H-nitrite reductase large subunit
MKKLFIVLLSALMLASQQGSMMVGMIMLLCYSAGLGIPFVMSAVLIDRMKNAFDLETSTLLKNNLTSKGINIYENSAVTSFNESSLIINDNLELNTDILVFSIGVKPNTNLCKNANINVNKGILVNEYLQTNIENIYSCGDACEYNGRVIGLWNNALDTAKVVANNINGNPTKVDKKLYPMVTKLFSDNYFSVGKITTDYHKIENDNSYIKYFFENDILVGCVLINREDLQKDLYQKIESGNTNKVDII